MLQRDCERQHGAADVEAHGPVQLPLHDPVGQQPDRPCLCDLRRGRVHVTTGVPSTLADAC